MGTVHEIGGGKQDGSKAGGKPRPRVGLDAILLGLLPGGVLLALAIGGWRWAVGLIGGVLVLLVAIGLVRSAFGGGS